MKKITLLFVFAFFSSFLNAQFKYGPRLSLGSSNLGSGSSSIGFQAGLFINAEIRDRSGIQFEVLYSVKNGVSKYTVPNSSGQSVERKDAYSFAYLDLPL